MKRIAVLTSGGDAPGMNAAIRSSIRKGIAMGFEMYGVYRGYQGLMEGDIEQMGVGSVSDILQRGGTMLRTARSPEFIKEEGQLKAIASLKERAIDAVICIGGDGTMRGAADLAKHGVNVMCLPGTIDNDMGYTDFTIGFDTAVNTVLSALNNIRDTSTSHDRTTIIEVMGRHCGDIALYTALAGGAECIMIPERPYDLDALCEKVMKGHQRGKLHNIIIKAEGTDISAKEVAEYITEKTGLEAKEIALSYIQRGGTPSSDDRILAEMTASKAIELIAAGAKNRAIGTKNGQIVDFDIIEALKMKREFKKEYADLIDILS